VYPNGTGNGTGNSSVGGYGDNQGAPLTLFQYAPNGTSSVSFVNSLVLSQAGSGANLPIAPIIMVSIRKSAVLPAPQRHLLSDPKHHS